MSDQEEEMYSKINYARVKFLLDGKIEIIPIEKIVEFKESKPKNAQDFDYKKVYTFLSIEEGKPVEVPIKVSDLGEEKNCFEKRPHFAPINDSAIEDFYSNEKQVHTIEKDSVEIKKQCDKEVKKKVDAEEKVFLNKILENKMNNYMNSCTLVIPKLGTELENNVTNESDENNEFKHKNIITNLKKSLEISNTKYKQLKHDFDILKSNTNCQNCIKLQDDYKLLQQKHDHVVSHCEKLQMLNIHYQTEYVLKSAPMLSDQQKIRPGAKAETVRHNESKEDLENESNKLENFKPTEIIHKPPSHLGTPNRNEFDEEVELSLNTENGNKMDTKVFKPKCLFGKDNEKLTKKRPHSNETEFDVDEKSEEYDDNDSFTHNKKIRTSTPKKSDNTKKTNTSFINFKKKIVMKNKNGIDVTMINIGYDFNIPKSEWDKIMTSTRPSLCTKRTLRQLYPDEELVRRSVTGNEGVKTPNGKNVRKAISPKKYDVIKKVLKYYCKSVKKLSDETIENETKSINKYITEDIKAKIKEYKQKIGKAKEKESKKIDKPENENENTNENE